MSLRIKLVTIGTAGVGKTCVISRFQTGEFKNEYLVTVGASFFSKIMRVEDEEVKLQIWDTVT